MKSLIFKLFLTALGGAFIMVFAMPWSYFNVQIPFSGPDYKLGLDLQGGIELDYLVDLSEVKLEENYNIERENSIIEGLKSIIDKRIETLNINDSVITSASYGGEEHIIVQIPLKGNDALENSDNIERAKAAIGKVVTISFQELRDTSNLSEEELSQLDENDIWIEAQDTKGRVLDDRYFVNSSVQQDQTFQYMVELTFNEDGAEIFGELTKRLVGQPMAIFVGGELLTAPTINEPILTGRAVISGNYTGESAKKLSDDINTGVVPAPIYLTSERTIDAKLGQSSLQKIIYAGIFGFIIILIFLVYIYRSAGIIAAVALFVYIAITLAILKQFGVVLTLASIAGLVLSIGIAIDANILIFERIKDELRKGNDIIEAQRTGFEKSFSAIWDANITGLLVALILFIFGINIIKGFGFILALGIIVSLFTVYFVSRLFIRLLARSEVSEVSFIGKK